MPKFYMRIRVVNNSDVPISAHVGASLVGVSDHREFYNTADDVKRLFPVGTTDVIRYLNTDLGSAEKYDLVVALWEGEKPIGRGIRYATFTLKGAVEKKKKIIINFALSVPAFTPRSFTGE